MDYYSAVWKKNDSMNVADKWMEVGKNHYEVGNPDTERQT